MKKTLFPGLIALAALTMTSCSNDENMLSIPQDNAIEFGTYIGRDAQTKGVVLNNGNLLNFGVFASYTNETDWSNIMPNFMFNQEVSRTEISSPWTYSPKKYWPTNQGDKISFWAYAPYATAGNGITVTSVAGATGTPILTYTLQEANLASQADLTTNVKMNVTKGATVDDPDGSAREVEFTLKHELTRVAISAKLDKNIDSNTKVNIKSVTFGGNNFTTKANYTFASTTDASGSWNLDQNSEKGSLSLAEILKTAAASGFGTYVTEGVLLSNTTPVPLFGENNYLFLIPFADGFDAGEITMTIEYDIVTYDKALVNEHSVTSATKVVTLPTNQDLFSQGYAYQFNLTFYMNEIKLSAKVDDTWGTGNFNTDVDWNDTDL